MNIVQVTGMNSSKYGGIEKFFVYSAKKATEGLNRYILIYESYPKSTRFVNDLIASGGEIYIMPSKGKNLLTFILKFLLFVKKNKIDVIHGHFNPAGDLANFVGLLAGVKKRFKSLHSMIQKPVNGDLATTSQHIPLKTRIRIKLSTAISSKIFCVSNAIKNQYNKLTGYSQKRTVLYLGSEILPPKEDQLTARKKLNLDPYKKYLLNIAMHVPGKKIEDCLQVLLYLLDRHPNIALIQIGGEANSMEYEGKLLDFVTQNKLEDHVIWVGLTDEVALYLNAADLLLHLPASEGLGLVAAEALSLQKPVIASNVGGLPELVIHGQNGFIVEPGDSKAASEYALILLENSQKANQLGKNSLAHIRSLFDVKIQAQKYIASYTTN